LGSALAFGLTFPMRKPRAPGRPVLAKVNEAGITVAVHYYSDDPATLSPMAMLCLLPKGGRREG
jgi:hypothetical protein